MHSRDEILAMILGEEKVFSIPAKFVIGAASGDTGVDGRHKMSMAGVGYVADEILAPQKWEMMECEVIVIPKRIYREYKEEFFEGLTICQMLTCDFGDREKWTAFEEFNKKE